MAKRWGWLTPNSPAPDELRCRSISVPDDIDLVAAVSGALLDLTKPYNWEQYGTMTPDEASQIMLMAVQDFMNDECSSGSCRRIIRIGAGGVPEQSDDGGNTWEPTTGDAEVPDVPEREEPTAQERRCIAAANASNVLAQVYEEMLDAWAFDQEIAYGQSVFAAAVAGLIGLWLGVISVGAINLALGIFGAAYQALQSLTSDAWDTEFDERIKCILYGVSTDVGGVVTFDFNEFLAQLSEYAAEANSLESSLLVAQVMYMMNWIGAAGLNLAGATTAITESDCGCGVWCYVWDENDDPAWDYFPTANFAGGQRGSYSGGMYISSNSTETVDAPNSTEIMMRILLDIPTILTDLEIVFTKTIGTASLPNTDKVVYDSPNGWYNGSALLTFNPGTDHGSGTWTWSGTQEILTDITIWMSAAIFSGGGSYGSISISKITMAGLGDNPFGISNCP